MNSLVKNTLELLGHKAKDQVTGAEGVITSVCFDLYGCVQAALNPGVDKDGKPRETYWYDIKRLHMTSATRVMSPPVEFAMARLGAEIGPSEKPEGIAP